MSDHVSEKDKEEDERGVKDPGDITPVPGPEPTPSDELALSQEKKPKAHPVTVEDVRDTLFDDDGNAVSPFKVSATWIREKLGRGSYSTIQKKLNAIRDETNRLIEAPKIDTPAAPPDVVDTLWKTAWEAAQSIFIQRCNELSANKDQLAEKCEMLQSDIDPVMEEVTRLEGVVKERDIEIRQLKEDIHVASENAAKAAAEAAGQLQESRTQIKILTDLIEKNLKPDARK
ncbi:MAG: DNA-binding protein [Mariprofundaceae bacterium]|nr:DNA-binding protein [Mariprofundaceae bacterium]